MNQHPVEQEEVMAYFDGEASPDRAAAIADHLAHCEECAKLAANFETVSQRMSKWTVGVAPARLRQKSQRRWMWVGAVAACLLVGLLTLIQTTGVNYYATPRVSLMAPAARPQEAARSTNFSMDRAPMIAKTSQLSLTTTAFDQARSSLEQILKRHNGYVQQLDITARQNEPRALDASLGIPSDQLDATMAEIKKLGTVESESQSGQDVTRDYVDVSARLSNARNTEERLRAILHDHTGKMSDVLEVEQEISRVRGEIEQMEAEKASLTSRVQFATLKVSIHEASKAATGYPLWDRLRNAGHDGYTSVIDGLVGVAAFLLAYGPGIVIWGALAFVVFRIIRAEVRRGRLLG